MQAVPASASKPGAPTTNQGDGYEHESRQKRRLLQALGAWGVAATLPERWIKPTVDTVLLPAHAQTTRQLSCEITRGEEGDAPRVSGGTFVID